MLAAQGYDAEPNVQRLLEREGRRAEDYYAAAEQLLPMIDPDGRAALWVMVTIYHELLQEIAGANYQVFGAASAGFYFAQADDFGAGIPDGSAAEGGCLSDVIVVGRGGWRGWRRRRRWRRMAREVMLLERRPFVGGRAYSYLHPALDEVVDSQHVLLGCCTNLNDLVRGAGLADKVRWYDKQTFSGAGRWARAGAGEHDCDQRTAGAVAIFRQLFAGFNAVAGGQGWGGSGAAGAGGWEAGR